MSTKKPQTPGEAEKEIIKRIKEDYFFGDVFKLYSVYGFVFVSLILVGFSIYADYFRAQPLSPKGHYLLIGLFLWYALMFFMEITSELKQAKKGIDCFSITNHDDIDIHWQTMKPILNKYKYEKQLTKLAYENRITKFIVKEETDSAHPHTKIDIAWRTGTTGHATLYLYRDTGDMQTEPYELRERRTKKRLGNVKGGHSISYSDPEINDGEVYNYYAWIEVEIYHQLLYIAFETRTHVVGLAKKPVVVREPKPKMIEKKPPSIEEFVDMMFREMIEPDMSREEAYEKLEKNLSDHNFTVNQIEIYRAKGRRFINIKYPSPED